ncbi:Nif3-like dinuclear metal center hexameric protein [Evansella sp. LMS18]|jgi:dinuclear metal center YbgI/SA1388 family protein|uniref:Nif3-like dinuclear metal center hexameric protein n=1 Tax=Evansella sp. LMS18 TaxID=2924033 RepID=UPI0020D0CFA1|nr:Nif3-like dinuclear metal center hexameric protein [Evansella sp. LMS18]UTR09376.1 Nif3-like dinuclear metal center hexameric protein [Evansella sp. LMS18]
MKIANAQTLIQAFESFSPKAYAVEGDKIGLQIGTLNKKVKKVMIALDVIEPVVDEAVEEGVDLIIAHHPIIFKPIKALRTDQTYGRTIEKLIKNDITVYAAHTNLDVAPGGVNDLMAEALGLEDTEVLVETFEDTLKKLVVFVPENEAGKVRDALGNAGAGYIGNYSHCSFNTKGTGTFKPGEGTDPFIGEQGKMEYVDEVKIETVFPASIEKKVIRAVMDSHPYEEVAYDIYELAVPGEKYGLGRIGRLKEEMSLKEFAGHVKAAYGVDGVRVTGDLGKSIKKVAVLGGDGNKYVSAALFKGADAFVTGDVYYHVAHDAMLEGLAMVDPGHNVEKIMKDGVKQILDGFIKENNYGTEVISSKINTDPFRFL